MQIQNITLYKKRKKQISGMNMNRLTINNSRYRFNNNYSKIERVKGKSW